MGKGNEKEEYADWSEEEKTVHRLRDGLREVVAEGSFGAGKLKKVSVHDSSPLQDSEKYGRREF